jgi:hypothetical protein
MDMGVTFLNVIIWLINVQSPKNPHKATILTLTKVDVIFQFGSSKRTTHKVHMNNALSKTFKNIYFWDKTIEYGDYILYPIFFRIILFYL